MNRPGHPVDLLFGAYRRNILSLLLSRPDESFYVREMARLSGVPAGSLHRELKLLAEAGLLVRAVSGNQVRYQADRACPIYEDLAAIFRKTTGLAEVLREALSPLGSRISLAFVFGSVAQGRERGTSDVDVLVMGEATFEEVVEALSHTRQRLGRDVNPVVMTDASFRSKRRQGDRFISRVVREPKIFLVGDAGELGQPAQDRPAQGTST